MVSESKDIHTLHDTVDVCCFTSTVTTQTTLCEQTRSKHIKDSKEHLFIMTKTLNMLILGVIPFINCVSVSE